MNLSNDECRKKLTASEHVMLASLEALLSSAQLGLRGIDDFLCKVQLIKKAKAKFIVLTLVSIYSFCCCRCNSFGQNTIISRANVVVLRFCSCLCSSKIHYGLILFSLAN